MAYEEGAMTSPMIALMRECINTPCRGSDLGANDLITVVRQECESPIKRTGLRSAKKTKAVSFEDVPTLSKSARKRRNGQLYNPSPRKPLASITNNENVRLSVADRGILEKKQRVQALEISASEKQTNTTTDDIAIPTNREAELDAKIDSMSYEIEEKDQRIAQLTALVKFLSAEVKIYTQSLEEEVETQKTTIAALQNRNK